nr:hypothetical protein [Thiocapsa sp. KS1]
MTYSVRTDPDYIAIENELEHSNGVLLDAWLMDGSEKRFPALVTEQGSGVRGFDIKPSSARGKKDVIGRKKICLEAFLDLLAKRTSSSTEHVRCQLLNGGAKNSKPITSLKFSKRLEGLLARLRSE